jgi:hypothetical protein
MRALCVLLCPIVVFVFSCSAFAQTASPSTAPSAKSDKADSEKGAEKSTPKRGGKKGDKDADKKPAAKEADPTASLKGDVVILKNGKQLKGVQVVSKTANEIEVEVTSGVRMTIPRKQVQDIQLDDIEPSAIKPGAAANAPKEGEVFEGNKLKPELSEKLSAPLTEPIKFENADVVKVLDELSSRFGVTIIVDDAVKAMPPDARVWTFETKQGMNAMGILQEELLKKFPTLEVVLQFDKILVTTKEKAAALNNASTPNDAAATAQEKPAEAQPAQDKPAADKAASGGAKPGDEALPEKPKKAVSDDKQ